MGLPLELRLTGQVRQSEEIWSFRMEPVEGVDERFRAGQVAVLEIEGSGSTYLAFAGAPTDDGYEFLVKRNVGNSFNRALFDLAESGIGGSVWLRQIVGHGFPVDELVGQDLVLVAMGTGLAPLRSVLREVFGRREKFGRVVVLYGARRAGDFCYQDEMASEWMANGVELRQVLSRPEGGEWSGPTGYVQSLLDNLVPTLSRPVALVCGSLEMIEQTRERLGQLGFPAGKILTNY
jgi:sulfhydrogenase subunit gamma (sulfur reductase)